MQRVEPQYCFPYLLLPLQASPVGSTPHQSFLCLCIPLSSHELAPCTDQVLNMLVACSSGITSWLYTPPPPAAAAAGDTVGAAPTVPIGRGIHNSRLYALDSCMRPVPIGVPGQLFISGVCLSGGYLNRPELNAATLVPNPFHEGPGSSTEIMYRTGRRMPACVPHIYVVATEACRCYVWFAHEAVYSVHIVCGEPHHCLVASCHAIISLGSSIISSLPARTTYMCGLPLYSVHTWSACLCAPTHPFEPEPTGLRIAVARGVLPCQVTWCDGCQRSSSSKARWSSWGELTTKSNCEVSGSSCRWV
jgi:hypothetical protein